MFFKVLFSLEMLKKNDNQVNDIMSAFKMYAYDWSINMEDLAMKWIIETLFDDK